MQITMVGHSTVLIAVGDRRLITDPYFGTWGNPAYARVTPPGMSREDVAEVDLVLISHNHWDHNDGRFLRHLGPEVPVVVPRRVSWLTRRRGGRNVFGMRCWQTLQFGDFVVTAVPAVHVTVAVGFVIQVEGRTVYFAGDTYHGRFFERLGREFRIDIALLPVTTYRIPMTMGERQAVRAVGDLSPRVVIPIHLGVQPRLPLMRTNQTPEGFARRLRNGAPTTRVVVLREGEQWSDD